VAMMLHALENFNLSRAVGLGIYPYWSTPGFHLEVTEIYRRWAKLRQGYGSFKDGLLELSTK